MSWNFRQFSLGSDHCVTISVTLTYKYFLTILWLSSAKIPGTLNSKADEESEKLNVN